MPTFSHSIIELTKDNNFSHFIIILCVDGDRITEEQDGNKWEVSIDIVIPFM